MTLGIFYEFHRKTSPMGTEDRDTSRNSGLGAPLLGKGPESFASLPKSERPLNTPYPIKTHLQEIEVIWNKSVLSRADLQKKQERLCDDPLIKALSQRLASASFAKDLIKEGKKPTTVFKSMPKIPFSTESMERQKYVKFLIQSVMWAENPIKPTVVKSIQNVILSQNINETDSEDQQKSIAGDKIELYLALHKADPEAAEGLLSQAEGLTWKVINYAHTKLNGPKSGILANIYK